MREDHVVPDGDDGSAMVVSLGIDRMATSVTGPEAMLALTQMVIAFESTGLGGVRGLFDGPGLSSSMLDNE